MLTNSFQEEGIIIEVILYEKHISFFLAASPLDHNIKTSLDKLLDLVVIEQTPRRTRNTHVFVHI